MRKKPPKAIKPGSVRKYMGTPADPKKLRQHLSRCPIWETVDSKRIVKSPRKFHCDSDNTYSAIKFENAREAEAYARFCEHLKKKGIFHPKTVFLVGETARNQITIFAIMPKLEPADPDSKKIGRMKEAIRSTGEWPFGDFSRPSNWGKDPKIGKKYFLDLHLFMGDVSSSIIDWFEKGCPE